MTIPQKLTFARQISLDNHSYFSYIRNEITPADDLRFRKRKQGNPCQI